MSDRHGPASRVSRRVPSDGRGFTILEILLVVGITVILFSMVILLVRDFLFTFIWSGETFSELHEAGVLHAVLRRDLMRLALDPSGNDLALTTEKDSIEFTLPGAGADERITYRFDPVAKVVWRQKPGGPAQALGRGLVRRFEVTRVYVRKLPGPRFELATRIPPGERPHRAGIKVHLGLSGQELGGTKVAKRLEFSTHFFPVFANLRLSAVWRER